MEDPRISDLIKHEGSDQEPSFILIGCPVDEGVERNGGRRGAAQAPALIRKQLNKMTPPPDSVSVFVETCRSGVDLGDISSGSMEEMQKQLGSRIAPWLEKDIPVIILGGGHETAYGHYLGYRKSAIPHNIINLDAHADVREFKKGVGHSGSPFRQILEDEETLCRSYKAAGLQPHAVAKSHLAYIEHHGGEWHLYPDTDMSLIKRLYSNSDFPVMTTFDMDGVDQSQAPGVSAPCANGLDKSLWLSAAYLAGRNPNVKSVDLVEVNPQYDRDDQTTRLAALTIWNFLHGLSLREEA